jgi:hypothetical protein
VCDRDVVSVRIVHAEFTAWGVERSLDRSNDMAERFQVCVHRVDVFAIDIEDDGLLPPGIGLERES